MLVFGLAGCASQKTTVAYDQSSVVEQIEFLIKYCQNVDAASLEQWNAQNEFSKNYQFMMSGIRMTPDSFDSALESWNAGVEECGAYMGHGDYQFTAKKDELDVTLPVKFEQRNATILFVFDEELYLQSVTVNAEYSLEEILQKAGLNTILGMGTVFAVLIFISILISLFRFIPMLQEALTRKPKKEKQTAPPVVVQTKAAEDVQDETDDLELVAVIAAAIAAYEGTDTDGFVVRSIKRRPSNKWNA